MPNACDPFPALLRIAAALALLAAPSLPAPALAQAVDVGTVFGAILQEMQHAEGAQRGAQRQPPRTRLATDADLIHDARPYAIDGRSLGDTLNPSRLAADFSARPSEEFPGATWYRQRRVGNGVSIATSILTAGDGTIQYYNKYFASAVFQPGGVASEIGRLTGLYRQQPRLIRIPEGHGVDGVIATWGNITLTPLDPSTMAQLANSQEIKAGLIVDPLGNAVKSARSGLPVYHIGGGAGYLWVANWDPQGHGNLRFGMADAARYAPPAPPVDDTPAAGSAQTAATEPAAPDVSQLAVEEQRRLEAQRAEAKRATAAAEQAARDAAAAQLKSERLTRDVAAAKLKLGDASAFVQANHDDPHLLEHLTAITELNGAKDGSDPETIERKTAALAAGLSSDPVYVAFAAGRESKRKADEARDLADVSAALGLRKTFLVGAVAQDPTGAQAGRLLTLAKGIDEVLAAANLSRSQTLMGEIDRAIDEAKLTASFTMAVKNATASEAATKDSPPTRAGGPVAGVP